MLRLALFGLSIVLAIVAIGFVCLPVLMVTHWQWWSLLLVPCSWVAGLTIGFFAALSFVLAEDQV